MISPLSASATPLPVESAHSDLLGPFRLAGSLRELGRPEEITELVADRVRKMSGGHSSSRPAVRPVSSRSSRRAVASGDSDSGPPPSGISQE